jgi:hypothetical protein
MALVRASGQIKVRDDGGDFQSHAAAATSAGDDATGRGEFANKSIEQAGLR